MSVHIGRRLALSIVLATVGCKREPDKPNLDAIVRGEAPSLPDAVAKIELNAPASTLDGIMEGGGDRYSKKADGMTYDAMIDRDDKRVEGIEVVLPEGVTIDDAARKAWGEPLVGEYVGEVQRWFNEEAGLLVETKSPYGSQRVKFRPYIPMSRLLPKSGNGLALEQPRPILGSTKKELAAAYPTFSDAGKNRGRIRLPMSMCGVIWTTVTVRFGEFGEPDKASSYELELKDQACEVPEDALKKHLSSFGPPTAAPNQPGVTMFSAEPMIALAKNDKRKAWTVAVVGVAQPPAAG